jgi:hypothetical protein
MSYFYNLGYQFKRQTYKIPSGSIIASSLIDKSTLTKRGLEKKYPHLKRKAFDPQLYLSTLDSKACPKPCLKLFSYPWYSGDLPETININEKNISSFWTGQIPKEESKIQTWVDECINFQNQLDCDFITLPSPLTVNINSDYSEELTWLDQGLDYIRKNNINGIDVFATIAISDICLQFHNPSENPLLRIITDSLSAREISGVYIVIEQSQESDIKYCTNLKTLLSLLDLVFIFSSECKLKVGVNYVGQFGLVCKALGADFWASDWYKSLYRFRLADKIGHGYAYPSFWSNVIFTDIHLSKDFDKLVGAKKILELLNITPVSRELINALIDGKSISQIPEWKYSQSNVAASKDHYQLSCIIADEILNGIPNIKRMDYMQERLDIAIQKIEEISPILGTESLTKFQHISSWRDALIQIKRDHNF